MRSFPFAAGLVVLATSCAGGSSTPHGPSSAHPTFSVTYPAALAAGPLDGRLLVLLTKDDTREPRFRVSDNDDTAQVFGIDVDGWTPDTPVALDGSVLGYPHRSVADLPAGEYVVQALLHRYETFHRGDGHTLKLPPDRGEGQQWSRAPGNLLSTMTRVRLGGGEPVRLRLDRAIEPLPTPKDTKYVRHVRIQSERLTKFWGRPTFLGAHVLLPQGWEEFPNVRYPIAIAHGHFPADLSGFREAPPDPSLPKPDLEGLRRACPNGHEGELCTKLGYPRLEQEMGFAFYKEWTGPGFPRVILVEIQHANPFYDDSYAVNSANVGPYGDAITYELLPYLEKTFRGLGPWARGLYGGSTGGWEAIAAQVFYPDEYNGSIANCPDPVDFHAYTTIDLYADANAYFTEGPFRRTPRPGERDYLGRLRSTVEQQNLKELVLGTKSRSGGQWDIWEAVYSPVGADGYPARIWDKLTGVIDKRVAEFWREHYDLGHILERDWAKLGPKLRGKLTLQVGLSDNFFLNDAVYRVEELLKKANPPADARVTYGARDEHCWSGDASTFNAVSRLTYHSRFVRALAEHWSRTAPAGADTRGWKY